MAKINLAEMVAACNTEKEKAAVILEAVNAGKEVLYAMEYQLEEIVEMDIYRVGLPVIGLEGYWVWFDAKDEYAEAKTNYYQNCNEENLEALIEAAGNDLEDAYDYDKVAYISTPDGEDFWTAELK